MKITTLTPKNNQPVELSKCNILIGPNNVGKTQTLVDLCKAFVTEPPIQTILLQEIILEKSGTFEDLLATVPQKNPHSHNKNILILSGIGPNLFSTESISLDINASENSFNAALNANGILGGISKFKLFYLNTEARLQLCKMVDNYEVYDGQPTKLLQLLFNNTRAQQKLNDAFKATFKLQIKYDSYGSKTRLRISRDFDSIPESPPEDVVSKLRPIPIIDDQGDGFRSFIGVVLGILLSQDRTVLIDEPEAFLHPAQARQLGLWIGKHIVDVEGQLIISTHSASFLSGVLEGDKKGETSVFRINRTDDHSQFNKIKPEDINALKKSPLLSSQRVMDALFHTGVVICEGDSDRAFYQTAYSILYPDSDLQFIHAHNKNSIYKICRLLKAVNVPVCAITDIDIINNKEKDLMNILETLKCKNEEQQKIQLLQTEIASELTIDDEQKKKEKIICNLNDLISNKDSLSLADIRGKLKVIRDDSGDYAQLKKEGINIQLPALVNKIQNLIDLVKKDGLFIVPVGELEGWLDLQCDRSEWIVEALEYLQTISDKFQETKKETHSLVQSNSNLQQKNIDIPVPLSDFLKQIADYFNALIPIENSLEKSSEEKV